GGVLFLRLWGFARFWRPWAPAPDRARVIFRADTNGGGAALVGALRPRIVVPSDFASRFSRTEQDLILAHEREHKRAGHAQLNGIAALLQILFWMNPALIFGLRVFRLDQELACDAAVLERKRTSVRRYGRALLRAQTGALAPLGCSWRPASGLQIRLKQLTRRAPGRLQRLAGLSSLSLLFAMIASASWAARPEMKPVDAPLLEPAYGTHLEQPAVSHLQLRGLDAALTIISEDRETIAFEGLAEDLQGIRSADRLVMTAGVEGADRCRSAAPRSQRFTVRVPHGVKVEAIGRVDAFVVAPEGGQLHFDGCGTVLVDDLSGELDLELGGEIRLTGGLIAGDLQLRGHGEVRAAFVELAGELRMRTSGGVRLSLAELDGSGRFDLSGGSALSVERWQGQLEGSAAGGSEVRIEEIDALLADFTVSGGASAVVETGEIDELRVDQAARASFSFNGESFSSWVRNRGSLPVVLADAGELDSIGLISTRAHPPDD
ncbi:MAG: M56 family metallopeptidase, partial [Pseudomonadota bacterium]